MKVKLTIDGRDVEVNPYVELVLAKVVEALVSTLRGVDEWRKVSLEVHR